MEDSEISKDKQKEDPSTTTATTNPNETTGDLIGKDTLDEIKDKDAFFSNLERNAGGEVDYGKLTKDLDGDVGYDKEGPV